MPNFQNKDSPFSGKISNPSGASRIANMTNQELEATDDIDFYVGEDDQQYQTTSTKAAGHVAYLLACEAELRERSGQEIVFSQPLISRNDTGIIGRGTINVVQGAYGSHKSRLAELFAALMLNVGDPDDPRFIGFKRAPLERFCVCYIDTERNRSEELPFAIQAIKMNAGYQRTDHPETFRFTTIKGVERHQRFGAIESFITHIRQQTNLHLFALIDVVTDAIGDFNDPKESMKLFDFLGNLCDRNDATVLIVIHQNPGTEKARGHTGTEAANKASTALQIGYERNAAGHDTDLIRLRFLKLRRARKPEPLYLQYCEASKALVLADASSMNDHLNQRRHKANCDDIADRLTVLLSIGAMPKSQVWKVLQDEFNVQNATIRNRLKAIMEQRPSMYDEAGRSVVLTDYSEGRNQFYKLSVIK